MSHQGIEIYTDGAALNNPGAGGYGIVMMWRKHRKEIAEGYKFTTNNRMELLAVIVALETLKSEGSEVTIYSDSRYVVDAIEKKWIYAWRKKGYTKIKNPDLWKRFMEIYPKHIVKMVWVKGHAGITENERCDFLANQAALRPNRLEDTEYLNSLKNDEGDMDL